MTSIAVLTMYVMHGPVVGDEPMLLLHPRGQGFE
tara:strand:- start:1782 stop:1883 length:102 start_codon:yes stop_codon:yes gene_type:complete